MILLDDHLTLLVLTGGVERAEIDDEVIATTSLWYLRLVAAVTAPPVAARGPGRLRRMLDTLPAPDRQTGLERILDPAPEVVDVLHPMRFAVQTARMQREHHLNILAAETLGAAVHHGASILVAVPNAGGPIERAAGEQNVGYDVLSS